MPELEHAGFDGPALLGGLGRHLGAHGCQFRHGFPPPGRSARPAGASSIPLVTAINGSLGIWLRGRRLVGLNRFLA